MRCACCGGALWASTILIIKASPSLRRTTSAGLLLYQLAVSAPLLLAASWALGELDAPAARERCSPGPACSTRRAVVAFASYLAWFWLLLAYPATRLSGFTFLTPLFGILAGGLLLGETLSAGLLVGLVAIIAGLRLINRPVPATA